MRETVGERPMAVGARLSADELTPGGMTIEDCIEAVAAPPRATACWTSSRSCSATPRSRPPRPGSPLPRPRRPPRSRCPPPRCAPRSPRELPVLATTRVVDLDGRRAPGPRRRRGPRRHDAGAHRRPRARGQDARRSDRRGHRVHRLQPGLHRPLPRRRADRLRRQRAHRPGADPGRGRPPRRPPRHRPRPAAARHRSRTGRRRRGDRGRARGRRRHPGRARARARAASCAWPAWPPPTPSCGSATCAPPPRVCAPPGSPCSSTPRPTPSSPRAYDAVVLASGARPYLPTLPATDLEIVPAWDAIRSPQDVAGPVLIADWGGGWDGLDAAERLAGAGREVTLACAGLVPGETLHQYQRNLYLGRLDEQRIAILHHHELALDTRHARSCATCSPAPAGPCPRWRRSCWRRVASPPTSCGRSSSHTRARCASATCSDRARSRRRCSRAPGPSCEPAAAGAAAEAG